ncbi:MAG: hypothetical protein KJ900_05630 [Proteobacteria bacterium]|jgi:hypothetical protein|nr:hypothetical protein [Desulfocapsa sp.]MBU3944921.1 hypothetical protein [Pseudomonadota bacterium]MBU4042362.1 hypothetical protein [Pseudomonadota bacterium]MBU4083757.1 hypothetical protein [Pseudomonadota bacterium]MBU4168192.1 hypothetical protein [Pseudomonadota bacterium]
MVVHAIWDIFHQLYARENYEKLLEACTVWSLRSPTDLISRLSPKLAAKYQLSPDPRQGNKIKGIIIGKGVVMPVVVHKTSLPSLFY